MHTIQILPADRPVKAIPIILALVAGVQMAQAQPAAFTYQGRLTVHGNPANGVYDFRLQTFDAVSAGASIGSAVNASAVVVSNGLFTALVDLGGAPFTGPARWLQISVSTNGAESFTPLAPRQRLTSSPYAIYANQAGTVTNAAIANAQLAANAVAARNVQGNSITSGKIASGQVVKSFNSLTDSVSIIQGSNITINAVGNGFQISAATGVPALPYFGSASSTGSVFTVSNSGAGPAGAFLGKVGVGTASPATLLHAKGTGPVMILQDTASTVNQAGYVGFWNNASSETGWMGFGTPGSPDLSVLNARSSGDLNLYAGPSGGAVGVVRGNVGIGTTAPAAALDVRGDIRMGPTGQFLATSGEENLRIVRGMVHFPALFGAPVIVGGSGFSVTGVQIREYKVTFTTPFASQPAVTVTINEGSTTAQKLFATTYGVTQNQFSLDIHGPQEESADRTFEFIAAGPR